MDKVAALWCSVGDMSFGAICPDCKYQLFGSQLHGVFATHSDHDYVIDLHLKANCRCQEAKELVNWVMATFRCMLPHQFEGA